MLVYQWVVSTLAAPLIIWTISYISDYALTVASAALMRRSSIIGFEKGLELNPYFRKDIGFLRKVSPRFIAALIVTNILLGMLWVLASHEGLFPALFDVVFGVFILMESAIHIRHYRNLVVFHYAAKGAGMKGHVFYETWFSLRLSAAELLSFAGLYLFLAALLQSWFLFGGFVGCLYLAANHWGMSNREMRSGTAGVTSHSEPGGAEDARR
ncbi:MAG TPA: hypothetical protein PL033_16280 [Candidatus Brocadiia bacterium]|nr:hypothetical protein [Candidatus Brocadiia bacterium]